MSTGYTDKIKDGITFPEFAMNCARAFGALIDMRDEPSDAEIPYEIKPSNYHKEEIENVNSKLIEAKNMSIETAKVLSKREYNEEMKYHNKYVSDKLLLKQKYESMLEHVMKWQPPTDEHKELKKFMIDQIKGSIDFDCSTKYDKEPELKSAEVWLREYINKCSRDLGYHVKEDNEEVQRCKERTLWIKNLRDSLE